METTVIDVIKQLALCIPVIMVGTQALTAAIKGIFHIEDGEVAHIISWVVSVLGSLGFVACNGLTFGLGGWDYLVAAVAGVIIGACSNGFYDWEAIKKFFDLITQIFGGKTQNKDA